MAGPLEIYAELEAAELIRKLRPAIKDGRHVLLNSNHGQSQPLSAVGHFRCALPLHLNPALILRWHA